ncbi:MAG: membrane dipeptidase [Microthrixaceae bacterium]
MDDATPEGHLHGPWIDIHGHPGRCFLGGLDAGSPLVQLLGGDEAAVRVGSASAGEVSVVAAASVADLAVLGMNDEGGLYAERQFAPGEAAADHGRQLAAIQALAAMHDVELVLGCDDIPGGDLGRTGVLVTCEGGDFLDGRLEGLEVAYGQGVRSVTLVHYRVNELGDIQTDDAVHGGLTGFGREVVREMNRLGMIVDLAHATFDATVQALEESSAPLMISHSHLAGRGADHPRLLTEEHARVVASAGGLIGAWPTGIVMETLDDFCDEICRLIDLVGLGHVAIGTDLDANYRPVLTSYEQFPEVAAGLARRGMTSTEVDRVLGGNFLDLFGVVEAGGLGRSNSPRRQGRSRINR